MLEMRCELSGDVMFIVGGNKSEGLGGTKRSYSSSLCCMWQVRPSRHWWCQTGHFHCTASLISALFILLSQSFISISIPHNLILQYISCDGIGCSNDSLWGKPITEYSSCYWYQKTVEWTSVLRSSLCILLKTLANIHLHQKSAVKNKI